VKLLHGGWDAAPHRIVDGVLLCRLVENQPADRATLFDAQFYWRAQGRPAGPWIDGTVVRGSRGFHWPASTLRRKSSTNWLKSAGSSRLMAWPLFGNTASPALGMQRFISRFASRHGSSSSPIMMSVGTVIFFIGSASS